MIFIFTRPLYETLNCLFYFFIFCVMFTESNTEFRFLCNSQCPYTISNKTQLESCIVHDIHKFPFPQGHEKSALQPTWVNSSWYIYPKTSNTFVVAFNLTWSQGSDYFRKHVKGYVLEISSTRSFASWKKKFTFTSFDQDQLSGTSHIVINYDCYGLSASEQIRPGRQYMLSLLSMPLYHEHADSLDASQSIVVPNCDENSLINNIEYCKNNDGYYYYDDDYNNSYDYISTAMMSTIASDNSILSRGHTVALLLSVGAFLVVLLSIGFYRLCWWKRKNVSKNQSLLFLISTLGSHGHSTYFDIAGELATIVKEYGNVAVSFNLWERTTISKGISAEWVEEKLKGCDHIVLISTPLGIDNYEKQSTEDPFVLGVRKVVDVKRKAYFNIKSCYSYSIVSFDDDSTSLTRVTKNGMKLPVYKLPKDFKSFFYNATGKREKAISRSSLEGLKHAIVRLHSDAKTAQLQKNSIKLNEYNSNDTKVSSLSDTDNSSESCRSSLIKEYQTETMSTHLSDSDHDVAN